MIDFEQWAKYFVYPLGKKIASKLAGLSINCLWLILVCFILALVVSQLIYLATGLAETTARLYILGNYVSILATIILSALLGCLFPWCHCVLLYQRGLSFTRALSYLGLLAGLFIIISTLWTLLFGTNLLPNQILTPFMVMALIELGIMLNWYNMTAISSLRRIALLCIPPLLMLELFLGLCGLYLFAAIVYLPVFLSLRPLLQWLRDHAELIVELPPLPEEEKD